jgi:hypothetical protein
MERLIKPNLKIEVPEKKNPIIQYIIKAHSASPKPRFTKSGRYSENRLDANPTTIVTAAKTKYWILFLGTLFWVFLFIMPLW